MTWTAILTKKGTFLVNTNPCMMPSKSAERKLWLEMKALLVYQKLSKPMKIIFRFRQQLPLLHIKKKWHSWMASLQPRERRKKSTLRSPFSTVSFPGCSNNRAPLMCLLTATSVLQFAHHKMGLVKLGPGWHKKWHLGLLPITESILSYSLHIQIPPADVFLLLYLLIYLGRAVPSVKSTQENRHTCQLTPLSGFLTVLSDLYRCWERPVDCICL